MAQKKLENSHLASQFVNAVKNSGPVSYRHAFGVPDAQQTAQMAGQLNRLLSTNIGKAHLKNKMDDQAAIDRMGTEDGLHFSVVDDKTGTLQLEKLWETTLPTFGGTIGAQLAPFDKEWLVKLDVQAEGKVKFKVVAAKDGEDLGPAGYRLDRDTDAYMSLRSYETDQPMAMNVNAGVKEINMIVPQIPEDKHTNKNIENMVGDLDSHAEKIPEYIKVAQQPAAAPIAKTQASEEPGAGYSEMDFLNMEAASQRFEGPAAALINATMSPTGEYHAAIDLDVTVTYTITVPKEDVAAVKAELDGATIGEMSLKGSVRVYNPGDSTDDPELRDRLFAHTEISDIDMEGDIHSTIAMKNLVDNEAGGDGQQYIAGLNGRTPQPANPYLREAAPKTMIAKADPEFIGTKDDIKLAQASCNLMIDGLELSVDGVVGDQTESCIGAVLGDSYDPNNYQKNAENLQELVTLNPASAEKAELYAAQVLQNPERHSTPTYSFQAYEKAIQGENFAFDGIPGKNTLLAAASQSGIEDQPGIEAIAEAPKPGDERVSLCKEFKEVCGPENAVNDASFENEISDMPEGAQIDTLPPIQRSILSPT